ncbi:MAG: hypothetical protein R3F54_26535 [Alphaproteobacteria bacterium]
MGAALSILAGLRPPKGGDRPGTRRLRSLPTIQRQIFLLAVMMILGHFGADRLQAQPAPSFSATCDDLREQADRLDGQGETYVSIEVTGELLLAESDDALAYMGLCSAPKVLCVTYELDDYKAGDRVTVVGISYRTAPAFITLDPVCTMPLDHMRPLGDDRMFERSGCLQHAAGGR